MSTPVGGPAKKVTIRVQSGEPLYRDPEGILIRVKQGDKLYITISSTTPLRKLKDRYCLTNSIERDSVAFWFASCIVEEVCCQICGFDTTAQHKALRWSAPGSHHPHTTQFGFATYQQFLDPQKTKKNSP
eukprot:GGOE01023011.1.p1 GENE.GGOE01023011.1~~GGOE01023011.1.p1  ORF type:complete len:139 (+),score=0.53 GGOE01023011.1:29-418(+)